MVIVRLLLVLGLATIGVAFVLYLVTRDRRYLRFIVQVAKVLAVALAGVAGVLPDRARPADALAHAWRGLAPGPPQPAFDGRPQRAVRQVGGKSVQGRELCAIPLTRNDFCRKSPPWGRVARGPELP